MTDIEDPTSTKKSTSNLKPITGGKASADPNDPPKKKSNKFRSIHASIVDAMLGAPSRLPIFPAKLHRWVDHEGNSQIYEQDSKGIVRFRADDHIHALIALYWKECCRTLHQSEFWGHLAAEDATKVRKLWTMLAPARSQKWLPLAWASSPKLALHKMPYDPLPLAYTDLEVSCPRFNEFMARTTNHRALMAWIGSLFDEYSQRQQYAWIYGGGGNGKSAVIKALMTGLGPVAASEQPPTRDAKHWTVGLRNKRLVVFADCNNTSFITSGDFKTLTGEDAIRIEPKGKPAYSEHIHAKFLVLSNDRPRISSTKADLRRALFFSVGDISYDFGTDYEWALGEEVMPFLSICWAVYREDSKGNPRYQIKAEDESEIHAVVEDTEHEFESFVDGCITVEVFSKTSQKANTNYIRAERMKEIMFTSGFRTEYERRKLREYLERKHGILRKKMWIDNASRLVYLNCRDFRHSVQSAATDMTPSAPF